MRFFRLNFYRGTKVYLTDLLLVFITILVCLSIILYSKIINRNDLIVQTLVVKTIEVEHRLKQIEQIIEKKWVEGLRRKR